MDPKELKAWCLENLHKWAPRGTDIEEYAGDIVGYIVMQSKAEAAKDRGHPILAATKASIQNEIKALAQLGLWLGRRPSEASMIARWDKATGGDVAELQPEYRGFIRLAREGMEIKTIHADVVYRGDVFHPNFTEDGVALVHRPDLIAGTRKDNDLVAAYAIIYGMNGERYFAWCDRNEIDKRKAKSRGNVWDNWLSAMARKTALRKLLMSGMVPLGDRAAKYVERELDADAAESQPADNTDAHAALAAFVAGGEE